jgi:hypothetical protein
VPDLSLHLAPNAPWLALAALSLAFGALAVWAYRFALPPLAPWVRRVLAALRLAALATLLWLLAQPVLERASGAGPAQVVVLLDRSRSMDLPARPGGPARAEEAERSVRALSRGLAGRARIEVLPFGARLGAPGDSARDATALGDALAALPATAAGRRADGVVVVSDGAANAGVDPAVAARALGIPVHAVAVGEPGGADRAVGEVEAAAAARVGEATPVRVRVTSTEPRGTPLTVRLLEDGRERARATVPAAGGGAEATAALRVTPARAGLAVWTARVDSLPGSRTTANDARQVAVEVAPGKLGVLAVSGGLNWDLAFLRRSLAGDSTLELRTVVRDRSGWRDLERGRSRDAPGEADLRGLAVVVLDAVAPAEVSPGFDRALAGFVRGGGGVLLLGGPPPGVSRFRAGALGTDLALAFDADRFVRSASPAPTPEGGELTAWDDDAVRGARAWRTAAPLQDLTPVDPGAGDRVLVAPSAPGPPLLFVRRVGRGQGLFVNGTGVWRWSLASHDALAAERGRRLWRRIARWLAEPVQGEPLRVRPERLLSVGGEPVRLFATLQDEGFRPIADAGVTAEVAGGAGPPRTLRFQPRAAGAYEAVLADPAPGRYRLTARATRGGRELGRASAEFAVDRWSLEQARVAPDSASLAAMARAAGGQVTAARDVDRWARGVPARVLARRVSASVRLWESPWVFAGIVAMLGVEWAWRRRRGLP